MVLVQKEMQNAYIGEYIFNFATQGPCPDGFHVPITSELQALYNAYTGLGLSGASNFSVYLKIPFSGQRDTYGNISGRNSGWQLRGASRAAQYSGQYIYAYNGNVGLTYNQNNNGYSIRPFYNKNIVPDQSWTTIHGTLESGGIFHNSTQGIISISSDGTNWITISDKNLGATQVRNNGDALSEANCGGVFQRGNNYMFPFDGTVSTSQSRVNASTYGPGNYYSSSTYIIAKNSPYTWDTSDNKNLRGGVDGNVPVS